MREITETFGFTPEEVTPGESTRTAPLKWGVVVDAGLPVGRQVNAAVCVAAATAPRVDGLLGEGGQDATGDVHAGLPWAGCTVLSADAAQLATIAGRAAASAEVLVVDMPLAAQTSRVYDEYLAVLRAQGADEVAPLAVSLVGPRREVDRLVKKLSLL
jgi:hypothetical protein